MKRFISLTLATTLLSTSLVFAELKPLDSDQNYYSAKDVAEEYGYTISWDNKSKTLTFKQADVEFKTSINSSKYYSSIDSVLNFDAPPSKIKNNKSYIPLEFVEVLKSNSQSTDLTSNNVQGEDIKEDNITNVDAEIFELQSGQFLNHVLNDDYNKASEMTNGLVNAQQLGQAYEQAKPMLGDFIKFDESKFTYNTLENPEIGTYYDFIQYAEFEYMGLETHYYFDSENNMIGVNYSLYELDKNAITIPNDIEEIDYKIGVQKSQNAKLTKTKSNTSDTVVILVSGSGTNNLDEEIYGNKPFRDIAWGLAEEGIDTFRFDKFTYALSNGDATMSPEEMQYLTVKEEYINDVQEVTAMLDEMGYENIYLLGHSQGAMLAPRFYEEVDERFDGLILLAGTPRTFSDIALDQSINALKTLPAQDRLLYSTYIKAEEVKIKYLDSYTEEELLSKTIFYIPAYYINEMNSYDTAELAKDIDKPILVLQGDKDFQVFTEPDFELWKEVLKDNNEAEFILYDDLGHLFTKAPDDATNTTADYLLAQQVDERVIDDIVKFINTNE